MGARGGQPTAADAPREPGAAAEAPPLTATEALQPGTTPLAARLGDDIERLKTEQLALRKARLTVQKELRNVQRRRKRLQEKARLLTNDDLLAVLLMRREREEEGAAAAAASDGVSAEPAAAATGAAAMDDGTAAAGAAARDTTEAAP